MELKLTWNTPIKEVKKQFAAYFPYLKLEFFIYRHNVKEGTGLDKKVHDNLFLSEITGVLKEGSFLFSPATTVSEFEQKLQNEYGLPVQVFRRSGNVWLETTETDQLSLEKQNEMGKSTVFRTNFNIHTLFL
jgi:hypothetical protein